MKKGPRPGPPPARPASAPEVRAQRAEGERRLTEWLRLARDPSVVRRALRTMAVVAPILIAINQGDALWRGELDATRALKIALTMVVPYAVSTTSSVAALRR